MVNMITSGNSTWNVNQLYDVQSVSSKKSTTDTTGISATSQTDSVDISKPAQLFSKLQALQKSDPEKFKQVCADIATKLKDASANGNDTKESQMLSDLAQKFQNVADGGDISQLKPPSPPSHNDGNQGSIGEYSQQMAMSSDSTSKIHKPSGDMDKLLSSLIDEVDSAIGS